MASITSASDTSERPKLEPVTKELEYAEIHTKPALINYVAAIFAWV